MKSLLSDISAEDVGAVAKLVVDVGFPEDVESMLLAETESFKGVIAACRDGALQKWESFIHYGTRHFWKQVCDDRKDGDTILQLIVTFLLSMGLRHPSCPTYRVITCLYCWLTHGQDKIMGIAKMDKYKEVVHVKRYFALRRHHAPPPSKYVKMLPCAIRVHEVA